MSYSEQFSQQFVTIRFFFGVRRHELDRDGCTRPVLKEIKF